MDSISLQHCLMRFGVASMGLRQSFGEFGDQMANGQPPWAAYMALVFGRLIGLDNCPRVRPVRMEETWHRMLAKCVLAVTGAEEK